MRGGAINNFTVASAVQLPALTVPPPTGPLPRQIGDTQFIQATSPPPPPPTNEANPFARPGFDQTIQQAGTDAAKWAQSVLRGEIESQPPGPVVSNTEEFAAKKLIGDYAVRPVKVLNWLVGGGKADPAGTAEPAVPVLPAHRPIQPHQLHQLRTDELMQVFGVVAARPASNADILRDQLTVANELARRGITVEQATGNQLIGVNALGGLISGSNRPRPAVEGGAELRHDQSLEVLEQAGALGQIVGSFVFPGWASDP